jgi:ATP-binding cassette subfamily G (WHITE) protein 2 (SNQ2)
MILALNPGGNTFYFGPVGDNGQDVISYFADRGVQCPPNKNVAEFILETAAKPVKRQDGTRINWDEEWKNSEQNKEMLNEIERIKSERSRLSEDNHDKVYEFAASIWTQTIMVTKRTFVQYWRDPSYLYGKLFVAVIIGIFNGFTFWQLGSSIGDMQNRMFTSFLIVLIPPTIVNTVVPKFFGNMALWQAREHPSRIYGWFAFTTAQIVAEIPIAIVSSVLYFVLWYFPTGLSTESSVSGYVFLMTMLFFLFVSSWGQWITAFAPSFTVISNVLPFFFVIFSLFNGIVRPYSQISVFWRYWLYYRVLLPFPSALKSQANVHPSQPFHLLDGRRPRRNSPQRPRRMQALGNRPVRRTRRSNLFLVRRQLSRLCAWLPAQPECVGRLPVLPVFERRRLSAFAERHCER